MRLNIFTMSSLVKRAGDRYPLKRGNTRAQITGIGELEVLGTEPEFLECLR